MGRLSELWSEVDGGYQSLDGHERAIARRTLERYGNVVDHWCDVLTVALDGVRPRQDIDHMNEDARTARVARMQFLALGIGHSKAALDAALGGNYHHAFFSVRYMCELAAQATYLRARSDQARRWYPQLGGGAKGHVAPTFHRALNGVREVLPDERGAMDRIEKWAKAMDDWGAHPSQRAIVLTLAQDGDDVKFGAMFIGTQFLGAAYYSIALTIRIVEEMGMPGEVRESSAWKDVTEAFWPKFHLAFEQHWGSDSTFDQF